MSGRISWLGVFMRLVGAIAVVLLTYNPGRLLLLSLGDAGLRCDYRSESVCRGTAAGRMDRVHPLRHLLPLGALGLVLSALVLGTLVWMLQDYGIINPDNPSLLSWITLIVIGIIFGIGLSWSLLRSPCHRSGGSGLKSSAA